MLDTSATVVEFFQLPSKGLIYGEGKELDKFKMRSMTTVEEMKRLSHSEDAYRLISEIIDDCVLGNLGISAYDMHIGDYQYMLHRLRVVTYGSEYKVTTQYFLPFQLTILYNLGIILSLSKSPNKYSLASDSGISLRNGIKKSTPFSLSSTK